MSGEVNPELAKAAKEEFQPGKVKAGDELPPAVKQALLDVMVPAIIHGAWEGIFALPDEAREAVFKAAAKRCHEKIIEFAGFDPGAMDDVDEFMAAWETAFGGMMRGRREGDIVHWECSTGDYGGCQCPLVRLGFVEPDAKLCPCSCNVIRQRFEMVVKRPVTVELLDSPLTNGAEACRYLIHLRPAID
jgi:hypothetical protein